MHLCDNDEPTPVAPPLSYGDLYNCRTSACSSGFPFGPLPGIGLLEDVTVTQILDPRTFLLPECSHLAYLEPRIGST